MSAPSSSLQGHLTPVFFFSHGSTMMLGEESESATFWKKAGDEALARGIKGIVMMGAHWDALGDARIDVSTNPNPGKSPVAFVHPSKYANYKLNPDLPSAERCLSLLQHAGFDARANPTFDWIHDTYLILIRMFPQGCPPTVLVSMNARYDPHEHVAVGSALRPLRREGYLLIGSGGAVHNLHRNVWMPMVRFRDNFAQEKAPEAWALEFRQAVEDVVVSRGNNSNGGDGNGGCGPRLRRAVTRLFKHPMFRDAHATDDHFVPMLFVAGAVGEEEDEGEPGRLMAETWELSNMCNSQFMFGRWPGEEVAAC